MRPTEVLNKDNKFAVIGLKNDPSKYVYKIYKRLLEEGYIVYGVSPYIHELDGQTIYQSLYEIPDQVEVAVFVIAPTKSIVYIDECAKLSINHLWMQPGTYDEIVLTKLESINSNYYLNCILRRLNDLNNEKYIDKI